ncbi:TauD/TfdA family dioxygenase [Streptosporangium sp. NPDC051022]|uniref:TauD/TfdA family dioxygenase n=1 Tax=Streptosporangium sp. NPDC051022 TaxID=3155752 RepID=UPI00342F1A81
MHQSISLDHLEGPNFAHAEVFAAKENLDEYGYAYLKDVPEEFDHISFLKEFGSFLPHAYDGSLIWELIPEPDMDDVYHSRNTRALVPHTEAYEYPGAPPRYLALWCVKPASGEGGETTLADAREWLRSFTDEELTIMRTRQYEWKSSEGLARHDIHVRTTHPILESQGGKEILRYSYNNVIRVEDGFLPSFLERGMSFFEENHEAISIERNGLLVWDNWRMLHSRNSFKDRGRHLRRVLISS